VGAIDNFLKRWGYAKLDQYGLVLTAEDRVISMRPAVLDDGLGAKIVGWREGDLAAMELEHWGAHKPKKPKKIIAPAGLHRLPSQPPLAARTVAPAAPALVVASPAPVVAAPAPSSTPAALSPALAAPTRTAPAPSPAPSPAPAPVVAAEEEPSEDEWEWQIAMARARAAAEEAEQARMDLVGAQAVIASAVIPKKTSPGMAVVAASPHGKKPEPEPLPPWPKTEPYNETWADKSEVAPQVMSVLQKKLAVEKRTPARGAATVAPPRSTVIPVPQLPTVSDPRLVRPAPYTPPPSRSRVARGTGAPKLEETVRTLAAPPANDDRTAPYIELPPEVKPSGVARTKRVAAKQR
jgi:hypothetical protein